MKILIICPYFFPRLGGMENYANSICKKIIEIKKWEIVVICSHWENDKDIVEYIDGIKIYRLAYQFKISSTPINFHWKKTISNVIEIEKPDIINGHTPVPYIADIGSRIAINRNIPYILTYQNDLCGYNILTKLLSKLYYMFVMNKTLKISNLIIASNEHYVNKSEYLQKFLHKIKVVNPGVNLINADYNTMKVLKQRYNILNEKLILFVGQLNKESQHKGLNYLFEAVKRISNYNLKIIVIGEGNYSEYYKRLAISQQIIDRIIFTGRLTDVELTSFYRFADLLVLPSYNRSEGFGMVLIEAQAYGLPVIGTTVGGIPSTMIDGVTGILIPSKDSKALSEAILTILNDPDKAKMMGIAGMERIRNEFTWESSAKKYIDIIKSKSKLNLDI